jgi:hypothetical protein
MVKQVTAPPKGPLVCTHWAVDGLILKIKKPIGNKNLNSFFIGVFPFV